ncbi:hypothetical protein SLU01_26370 [Sporosarcina luteola]|uniref:Uncharacterized protein n=1 Tax=Sporosarcina luteola TaxID=582850 RepID=A0A511ZA38_9BACL|nr:hypothetical protein SLU01_26370 [Sporosarcina luteola]
MSGDKPSLSGDKVVVSGDKPSLSGDKVDVSGDKLLGVTDNANLLQIKTTGTWPVVAVLPFRAMIFRATEHLPDAQDGAIVQLDAAVEIAH